MTLREELKKISGRSIPYAIQVLLDNGLIQECEEVGGVYYITFVFRLLENQLYNYKDTPTHRNFSRSTNCDIFYYGGMAISQDMTVLKGIIYPFYESQDEDNELFETFLGTNQLEFGTPQIITKNMHTSLHDWFKFGGFTVYNLFTSDAMVWGEFKQSKESYDGCKCFIDEKGKNVGGTYYGYQFSETTYKKLNDEPNKYKPVIALPNNSLTISTIERILGSDNLRREIAGRIYSANIIGNSITKGCKVISDSNHYIGNNIGNLANAVIHMANLSDSED